MRIASFLCTACLTLLLASVPGCGKKKEPEEETKAVKKDGGKAATTAAGRVELKAPLDGKITGRVTLDGAMPFIEVEKRMTAHTDSAHCLNAEEFEKIEQKWIISKDKGVANVVIFLRAPKGQYFPIKDQDKTRTDKVIVKQPHCAYIPHVSAAFPSYFDGKGQKRTGQAFAIANNSTFNHNTSWKGDTLKTGTGNRNLKAGDELPIELQPESEPILLACDIHPWMNAKVWAFDHPYFAVTDMDGKFEINNVPTGVEVGLVAWHEVPGYFHDGKEGKKIKFNPGDNQFPLTISAK